MAILSLSFIQLRNHFRGVTRTLRLILLRREPTFAEACKPESILPLGPPGNLVDLILLLQPAQPDI